jgi:hypothetical protein
MHGHMNVTMHGHMNVKFVSADLPYIRESNPHPF